MAPKPLALSLLQGMKYPIGYLPPTHILLLYQLLVARVSSWNVSPFQEVEFTIFLKGSAKVAAKL